MTANLMVAKAVKFHYMTTVKLDNEVIILLLFYLLTRCTISLEWDHASIISSAYPPQMNYTIISSLLLSFTNRRDISIILKKHGVNHGLASIDDDGDNNKKSHSNNEKATQAYKLFSEGKEPVQVAIELNLRE
jgi:hypothetical protein